MRKFLPKISLKLAGLILAAAMAAFAFLPRAQNQILADYYFDGNYNYNTMSPSYGYYTYPQSGYNYYPSYGYQGYNYNYSYNANYYPGYGNYNYNYNYPTYYKQPYYGSGAWGQISYQNPVRLAGTQCLYTTNIQWSTSNVTTAYITVRDPTTGAEKLFASGSSGGQIANWIVPNYSYRFTLWSGDQGQMKLAETWVYVGGRCSSGQYYNQPYNYNNSYNNNNYNNNPYPTSNPVYNNPSPTPNPAPSPSPSPTTSQSVTVVDNSFSPGTMTISAGTTVTWTNNGSMAHTVTADTGMFDSGTLNPGQSYSYTFSSVGTFRYYCRFHGGPGGAGMSGTIVVQ